MFEKMLSVNTVDIMTAACIGESVTVIINGIPYNYACDLFRIVERKIDGVTVFSVIGKDKYSAFGFDGIPGFFEGYAHKETFPDRISAYNYIKKQLEKRAK